MRKGGTAGQKAVATVVGVSAVVTSFSGTFIALATPAEAVAAAGQDVNNDWGQTAAEVTEEVNLVVDADAVVVAARTRYLAALSSYASLKQTQAVALHAYRSAVTTRTKLDDARTLKTYQTISARVYTAAREVVASQLAMTQVVNATVAKVRSLHYIQAPYVALPSTPVGLSTLGASGQITLTWPAVAGTTTYHVYRDGIQVAVTLSAVFLDTGLDNGIAYSYRVLATNVAGWSALSNAVVGTPTVVAPPTPTSLVASPGDGQVSLAWAASPSATGYRVYRGGSLVGSPTSPSFLDVGLLDATAYSYTVVALNGSAASAPTGSVSCTPVATAPGAPSNLVATPGNAQVNLTWTAPTGATSYDVLRGGVKLATVSTPTYRDSAVANGTSYSYTVIAYRLNSPGSIASSTVSATPVAPPLSTPTGLAATPGDATVSLVWTSVSGAVSYRVYRGGVQIATPSTPSYTDTTVVNGTAYSYFVVAVGTASNSAPSATVTATPAAAATGAPTGLSGVAGDKTATLSWTAVAGATSYKIYRGGVSVGTSATTSYADLNLTNGTVYSYYVTAVSNTVESAASSTVQVTPFVITPAAPTGLTATPGNAQVSLSWTTTANATGYKVYRAGVLVATQAGTSFLDSGLTNGVAYSYTVIATNGSASSPASTAATATPMAPAPTAPTGLVATPGNAQVSLSWTAVASATSYRVYRGGVLVASPTTTTFTDTALTNGTAYTYYVIAVATTTPGPASASVVATPAKPPVSGTFTGTITSIASGHGTLRVVIVLTNNVITSSTGTLLTNDGTETVSINQTAIPQYNTKAVAANSATITKVSGATLTWAAYKTSLQSALTLAGL